MLVLDARRDGPSWASLVTAKILDSFLPFCGKQARSWMMTHLDSAREVRCRQSWRSSGDGPPYQELGRNREEAPRVT